MTSPDIDTIGVLTSGGDCPGLNAVIRGVVRKAERQPSQPKRSAPLPTKRPSQTGTEITAPTGGQPSQPR